MAYPAIRLHILFIIILLNINIFIFNLFSISFSTIGFIMVRSVRSSWFSTLIRVEVIYLVLKKTLNIVRIKKRRSYNLRCTIFFHRHMLVLLHNIDHLKEICLSKSLSKVCYLYFQLTLRTLPNILYVKSNKSTISSMQLWQQKASSLSFKLSFTFS